jgi:hypothetical protein
MYTFPTSWSLLRQSGFDVSPQLQHLPPTQGPDAPIRGGLGVSSHLRLHRRPEPRRLTLDGMVIDAPERHNDGTLARSLAVGTC